VKILEFRWNLLLWKQLKFVIWILFFFISALYFIWISRQILWFFHKLFIIYDVKVKKIKAVPPHASEALGVKRRYDSYSFLTSAVYGVEWSASRPGCAQPPGKGPPVFICDVVWTEYLIALYNVCLELLRIIMSWIFTESKRKLFVWNVISVVCVQYCYLSELHPLLNYNPNPNSWTGIGIIHF
jgi:hypothetical protein